VDRRDLKLRRYEDDLNVCGIGVMILGGWEFLKVIIHILMNTQEPLEEMLAALEKSGEWLAAGALSAMTAGSFLYLLLIVQLHIYIGRNACRAAKGAPFRKGYYIWAVILFVITIVGMAGYAEELRHPENIATIVASILVDLTYIYILGMVIVSTRRIRALRQMPAGE